MLSPVLWRQLALAAIAVRLWDMPAQTGALSTVSLDDFRLDLKLIERLHVAFLFDEHSVDAGADLSQHVVAQAIEPVGAELILDVAIHSVPTEAVDFTRSHLEDRDYLRVAP